MMDFNELKSKMKFREADTDPTREAFKNQKETAKEHVEAGRWSELATWIETLDQSRATAPDDRRLTRHLIDAICANALKDVRTEMGACGEYAVDEIRFEGIDPFIEAAKLNPENYSLNCLAAKICLDVGTLIRGGDYAAYTSNKAFERMEQLFNYADVFLDRFDAQALNSPLVAGLKYKRLAGINCELRDLRAAFDVRMQLDPHDLETMAEHAFYLLPRWYGDYDILNDEARKVFATTHLELGASAYAAFYLELLDVDEGALATVDVSLLDQGMVDMIRHSGDPQTTVNRILGLVSTAMASEMGQSRTSAKQKRELRTVFARLVREELDVVLVPHWRTSRKSVIYGLADVFAKELRGNEVVTIGQVSSGEMA
ncbi:MAG: hypothetical protein AAFP85_03895 [Pseudomonadota bacterium]